MVAQALLPVSSKKRHHYLREGLPSFRYHRQESCHLQRTFDTGCEKTARRKQQLKLTLQPLKRVVIGYCRCSTEEQSQRSAEFNTLQAQEKMIRNYHTTHYPEWTLVMVVARAEVIGNEVRTYIPVASVPEVWLESNSSMVEAGGIEPPSRTVARSASTSVVRLWLSQSVSRRTGRPTASLV